MKQTTFAQRLAAALVALCMVLSVCAPALAAEPGRASAAVIYYQKDGGTKTLLDALSIKTLMPGYKMAAVGNVITITMASTEHTSELDGVTLSGNGSDPYNFELCTAGTSWVTDISNENKTGLTITGMKNVTVKPAKGSNIGFLGSLKIVDCTGDVNIQNSSDGAVIGRLEVDNSAGHGNVTITENCDRTLMGRYLPYGVTITSNGPVKIENANGCAVCGSLEIKESASVDIKGTGTKGTAGKVQAAITGTATISSNGPVRIENQLSNTTMTIGAAVGYLDEPNITGTIFEVKKSASVEVIGAGVNPTLGGWAFIKSSGDVSITNSLGGSAVGRGLTVTTGGAVTVTGDNDAAIKSKATITAGRNVSIQNKTGIAVEGKLIVNSSTGVTVVGNTQKNAVRDEANITSSGAVNISNSSGIAVGGKLTVKNASGTGDVTVTGNGNATLNNGADITSGGAVSITNTGTGLAVSGDLTVHDSKRVKVSGGTDSSPAVSGDATLTSTGTMELKNSNGQVLKGKLTVKNSTGDVTVTGSKSGSAMVASGTDINTTGAVTITNSSGPAVFGGLNVEQSGGITVKGSRTSAPIITSNSTIKNTDKVEIVNQNSGGQTAESITYTPPAGKGYFYQTAQGGTKLHTRKAISGTTPYLCIEPDTLYTLTLSDGVTATTGGTKDTKFYAGESVTVTAPADTETNKFKQWTGGDNIKNADQNWQNKPSFSFTMPDSAVSLTAEYKTAYTLTVDDGRGSFTVNGAVRTQALEGETVKVKTSDAFFNDHRQFNGWSLSGDSAKLVDPPANWENSETFTFTMPAGDVSLKADYKQLYDLTVKDGTIVDESGDTGETTGIYLPGTQLTVRFTDSNDIAKQFKQWTYEGTRPEAPEGTGSEGGWDSSKEKKDITFTMPAGDVTLKAEYKDVYTVSVENERGTVLVNGEERSRALAGETVTVEISDTFFNAYHQFDGWSLSGDSAQLVSPSENWENSETFTFTMPAGNVSLKADYKQLYDLTVTGGTIGGETTGIYLPGTQLTVRFTDSNDIAKQFKQWTYEGTRPEAPEGTGSEGGWDSSKEKKDITFTMPAGDVTLKAEYKDVYTVSVENERGTVLVNGEERSRALAGETVTVEISDTFFNAYHQFDGWSLSGDSAQLVSPSENWENSETFTFKMPAGNVSLTAGYKQLYDLTVKGGTIEGGTDDNGIYKKIVKPGELVTVRAESTEENPFLRWNSTSKAPEEPDGGWTVENWQTSPEFTFKMPSGNVTLEAQRDQLYKVSIHDSLGNVTINGEPCESLWVKDGDTVTVATTLKDGYSMEFEKWTTGTNSTTLEETSENWQTSTTFTFKMPKGTVDLTASWMSGAIERPDPEDPNTEPLDPGFTVDPEPAAKTDTAGAALVAAAVGGAAVWGGYEVATRVLLHKLLPEGAAIPKTRAELALLLWNAAGQPEPAAVPAFADVADPETAKAAQWCTEQGCLTVKEPDRFQPDKHVTKYRVIDCWNKAFPAA